MCIYTDSQRLKSTNVLHANAYMNIHTYNHYCYCVIVEVINYSPLKLVIQY